MTLEGIGIRWFPTVPLHLSCVGLMLAVVDFTALIARERALKAVTAGRHASQLNSDPLSANQTTHPSERPSKREDTHLLECLQSTVPAVYSLHRPRALVWRFSAERTLQSQPIRAPFRKRPRVSFRVHLWLAVANVECRAGSGFKLPRRNDAGGEGSAKKERSTGVRHDKQICCSSSP